MRSATTIPFCHQLKLLIKAFPQANGSPYTIRALAQQMAMSPQALLNLLDDSSHYPRLETVRRLCRVYGISMDYFDCSTEKDCLDYLARQRVIRSTELEEIARSAEALTSRGQRNVLNILEWLRRARR